MKKFLIIMVSLMLLFSNIPIIASATSEISEPTITLPQTGDTTVLNDTSPINSIVSFNSNGGSEVANLLVEYNGQAIAPTDPTKTGYTFGGWYKETDLCKY